MFPFPGAGHFGGHSIFDRRRGGQPHVAGGEAHQLRGLLGGPGGGAGPAELRHGAKWAPSCSGRVVPP